MSKPVVLPAPHLPANTGRYIHFHLVGDLLRQGLRPPRWVVESYLESDAVAMMFGEPGACKSFIAVDLGCCVASGTPWHGHDVMQGGVFYIAGEGTNGLHRRVAAWEKHHGVSMQDAPLLISSRAAQFVDDLDAAAVANRIAELADLHSVQPVLIVIDTLARNFGVGDENGTRDMAEFIANVDMLLRSSALGKPAVLIVHHTGHGDKHRARGSSALKGAVDAEYGVYRDKETGTVTLRTSKMKDAPEPPEMSFSLQNVDMIDFDGQPFSGAVLVPANVPARPKPASFGKGKNQLKGLAVLRDLAAKSETGDVAVADWREALSASGINKDRFREVRASLIDSGDVIQVDPLTIRLCENDLNEPF